MTPARPRPRSNEILHWLVAVEVLHKRWAVRGHERSMVSEADARGVPGALNDCCLICETESAIRRIWHYPVDWHRLEDAKLMALFDAPFDGGSAHRAMRNEGRECPRET